MPIVQPTLKNLANVSLGERRQLLEYAIKRENERRPASPPIQIVTLDEYVKHLKNEHIDKRYHNSRYQLLIQMDAHYVAVDIDKREGNKSVIILDAAHDLDVARSKDAQRKTNTKISWHQDFHGICYQIYKKIGTAALSFHLTIVFNYIAQILIFISILLKK